MVKLIAAGEELDLKSLSDQDIASIVKERGVYQLELEAQDEELKQTQLDADIARDRFEILYNNSPVGYLTMDGTGVVAEIGDSMCTLLGIDKSAILGKPFQALLALSSADELYLGIRALLAGQARDLRMVQLPGRPDKWFLVESVLLDLPGSDKQILSMVTDKTESEEAKIALTESEKKLKIIADNTSDWEYWRAPDGKYLWVSPACERISGLPPEAFTSGNELGIFGKLVHPLDRHIWEEHLKEISNQHGDRELTFRIIKPTGEIVWISNTSRPILSSEGAYLGLRGCNRDITERRTLEQSLTFLATYSASQSGLDFFQALAKHLAETLGMDFVCIDRLEGDALSARTLAVYFDGHFEDNITYALQDTPCGDVVGKGVCCFPRDVRGLFPKDEVLQVMIAESYVGVTLWDSAGTPQGLIAVIGRRSLANTRLVESILQLVGVRASGELERLLGDEAKAKSLREKEVLLSEVHHRVKNNLQIISSLLSLQKSGMESPDALKVISDSRGRIMSMALIHEQLYRSKDFSGIEMGAYIREFLPRLVSALKGHRMIDLQIEVPVINLLLDQAIPFGLIMNELVTNIFKHGFRGRESGTIRVTGLQEEGRLTFTVEDDGVGLPDGFELEAVESLGLKIVTMLADQLHGSVSVVSGIGVCWRLQLPIHIP